MTTMSTETLPAVRLITEVAGIPAGLYPLIRPDALPVGYAGCLLLPEDYEQGWVIDFTHPEALRPYVGRRGWWVTDAQIEATDETIPITLPEVPPRLADVPLEHHAEVPATARWCRTSRIIDGLPAGERFLAIPAPPDREARGPILLAWPDHERYTLFGNRPGLPERWRGWWSGGDIEWIEVEWTPRVGEMCTVLEDPDAHQNNGRQAVIMEADRIGTAYPFRVKYLNDGVPDADYGGDYGWVVSRIGPPEPVTATGEAEGGPLRVGDRVRLIDPVGTGDGRSVGATGTVTDINDEDGNPLVTVRWDDGGGHSARFERRYERITTEPETEPEPEPETAPALSVGDWFTWGSQDSWFRVDSIEGATVVSIRRCDRRGNGEVDESRSPYRWQAMTALMSMDNLLHCSEDDEALPSGIRDWVVGQRAATNEGEGTSDTWFLGQRVDVDWPGGWAGPATVTRVGDPYISVRSHAMGRDGGFEAFSLNAALPEPGDWFTWGAGFTWFKVDYVEGDVVVTSHESVGGRVSESALRYSVPAMSRIRSFRPDSPHLPSAIVDWETERSAEVVTEALSEDDAAPVEPTPDTTSEAGTLAASVQIERLRQQLAEAQEAHRRDVAEIARIMKAEADDREWCSEYEDVAERINEAISIEFEGERTRSWRTDVDFFAAVTVRVHGRVDHAHPRTTSAREARAAVRAQVMQALRNGNHADLNLTIDGPNMETITVPERIGRTRAV